jgi:fibronectin-binding autotransporter adhesin
VTTTTSDNLTFSAGADATGSYTLTVNGAQSASRLIFNTGRVTLTGGSLTVTSSITLQTASPIVIDSPLTGAASAFIISNTAAATPAFLTLTQRSNNTGTLTVTGPVTLDLNAPGGNAVTRSSLTISSQTGGSAAVTRVRLDASNQVGDATVVDFAAATAGGSRPIFETKGFNDTIAGINMAGVAGGPVATFRNGAATDSTVTLAGSGMYGASCPSSTCLATRSIEDGAGGGKLNIVVALAGAGTEFFAGTGPSYTGTTTINSGLLRLQNTSNWSSNVILNGGTLQLEQLSAATILSAGAATRTHANTIGGTGGTLLKVGDGTVILTGANTYQGATTVNAGVLQAGSNTAFGNNSAVTLANIAGATLDLNGFNVAIGSLAGGGATGGAAVSA